jgi:hypothetical protein
MLNVSEACCAFAEQDKNKLYLNNNENKNSIGKIY